MMKDCEIIWSSPSQGNVNHRNQGFPIYLTKPIALNLVVDSSWYNRITSVLTKHPHFTKIVIEVVLCGLKMCTFVVPPGSAQHWMNTISWYGSPWRGQETLGFVLFVYIKYFHGDCKLHKWGYYSRRKSFCSTNTSQVPQPYQILPWFL